jgi:hypothetical protein
MDAEDIEALRASVELLRAGTDTLVRVAETAAPGVDRARLADLRATARHIDELLGAGEPVVGDGFVIAD